MAEPEQRQLKESAKEVEKSAGTLARSTGHIQDSAERRTELAADRNVFAAERTYAAWVRTGLAALASGVGAKAALKDVIPEYIVLAAGTVLALVPLVLVIYFLLQKGLGAWSGHFFTSDPNGNFLGDPGGIRSAILGTVEIVALATLISVPL
ncbi:MAG: phosphate transport system permease protein, partial [Methylobacteriaceae bacterium]|nr:phosphate transport system permease protein [Methylobacteriaceae bacterium]